MDDVAPNACFHPIRGSRASDIECSSSTVSPRLASAGYPTWATHCRREIERGTVTGGATAHPAAQPRPPVIDPQFLTIAPWPSVRCFVSDLDRPFSHP